MRFVCFGYIDESKWELKSEDEQTQVLQDYFAFYGRLRESEHFISGEGLRSVRESVHICLTDGQVKVIEKADAGEQLGGFFILEARDMNQALCELAVVKKCLATDGRFYFVYDPFVASQAREVIETASTVLDKHGFKVQKVLTKVVTKTKVVCVIAGKR